MSGGDVELQEKLSSIDSTPLDVNDDLADVIEVIDPLAASWKEIGTRLRLPADRMDAIASENTDVKNCLLEVSTHWLRRNYDTDKFGEPSWRWLARVCYGINGVVFKEIAEGHKVQRSASKMTTTKKIVTTQTKTEAKPEIDYSHPALLEKPTPKLLLLIKYTDSSGSTHRVRPEQLVAYKWREMGSALGFAEAKLKIWTTQFHNDQERAHAVLSHWLANGSENYSSDWKGFLELCVDLELSEDANDIRKAIIANFER